MTLEMLQTDAQHPSSKLQAAARASRSAGAGKALARRRSGSAPCSHAEAEHGESSIRPHRESSLGWELLGLLLLPINHPRSDGRCLLGCCKKPSAAKPKEHCASSWREQPLRLRRFHICKKDFREKAFFFFFFPLFKQENSTEQS